jgi:two-component system OmpR family response regulator
MRILLIEDDKDVAQLVITGMGEANHQVTHESEGNAGLARALAENFDVMIFDRQLPGGVDGANLMTVLREKQVETPMLFLSGLGGLQDWMTGLDAGSDDYIVKPFVFADLLARVEMLHQRRLAAMKAGSEA